MKETVLPTSPRHSPEEPHCSACTMRSKSIFCAASREEARLLDQYKAVHSYKKGQTLFYEGTPAAGVYCVFSGSLKLYKSTSGGRQEIIGLAGPGDVVGYQSLFTDKPLSLSAEALEDSRVCLIDKSGFRGLAAQNPSILTNIIKELSQDLESVEDRLVDQVDKPAHVRLARLLLVLKETHGRAVPQGIDLDVHLSRQEIAAMIGTTQETAIRLLSRFKARGLIKVNKRSITLVNPEGLLKTARISV